MSLVMLCFPCCVDEQPPPRRRPKIDRNMIGAPMNFKHTGHIGSGEVSSGFDIHNVQDQMQSKGGYKYTCALSETQPDGLDLTSNEKEENNVNVNNKETDETINEGNENVEENEVKQDNIEIHVDKEKQEDQESPSEPNRTTTQDELRQTGLC